MEDLAQQTTAGGVVIEHPCVGMPHAGKVLVAIQPHSDDIQLFAVSTAAKLIREEYTGHLIRVTNDDMGNQLGFGESHSSRQSPEKILPPEPNNGADMPLFPDNGSDPSNFPVG